MTGCARQILEQQRKRSALWKRGGVFDFKDRFMGFTVARMHSPLGVVLPINRLRGGKVGAFIVIGGGAREHERLRSFDRGRQRGKRSKLREVKIAVVPATRSAFWQPVIGQHFQPHRAQLAGPPVRGDDIGVALRSRAAREP